MTQLNLHLKSEVLSFKRREEKEKRSCAYIYIIDSREANADKIGLCLWRGENQSF